MLGAQGAIAFCSALRVRSFSARWKLTLIEEDIGDGELHPGPLHRIAGKIGERLGVAQPL